jgi:hypothetical protein
VRALARQYPISPDSDDQPRPALAIQANGTASMLLTQRTGVPLFPRESVLQLHRLRADPSHSVDTLPVMQHVVSRTRHQATPVLGLDAEDGAWSDKRVVEILILPELQSVKDVRVTPKLIQDQGDETLAVQAARVHEPLSTHGVDIRVDEAHGSA